MPAAFNLHILPVLRKGGVDQPSLPGLFIADSHVSRRVPHSRKDDLLILHLVLTGTATIKPDGQTQLLENLAEQYFSSPGAVTSALREAFIDLNQFLLDRNLTSASSGLQATGLLTAVVLHEARLYLAQSGPSHIFTISRAGAVRFHDPDMSGRGLGISRVPDVHFNHAQLGLGDLVILTPEAVLAWRSDSLSDAHGRSMNTIHRVLMNAAGDDVNAVLVQAHPGKGAFKIVERDKLEAESPVMVGAPATMGAPTSATGKSPPADPTKSARSLGVPAAPAISQDRPAPGALEAGEPGQAEKESASGRRRRGEARPVGPMILAVLRAFWNALKTIGYSLRAALSRILPGNELFTIPSSWMAFIALAIPIVVVAVAGLVYIRRGQARQYNEYVNQANTAVEFANTTSDPANARLAWQAVLDLMDSAEAYQVTDETQALRQQAFEALDPLELVERLDFRPALNGALAESVDIVRMVATRDELYMLDAASGSVIRAWLSGRGYEIDTEFRCGPGSYGSYLVGTLLDIAPLPRNNSLGAAVMAMDSNGIAVYCQLDSPPIAVPLAPPDSNWGDPRAFELNSGALYVLDPQTNAVWIYVGEGYAFINPPSLFFDEDIPPMADVIDFAIDLDDLYMLHADGHITTCTFGFAGQPTRCTDPALFGETRPGRESGATMEGTAYSQIDFTSPPDPSIYLLDPTQAAIYHFSLRLTFQRQLREVNPLGEPASAFAISPSRTVFLAMGHQVLWAALP